MKTADLLKWFKRPTVPDETVALIRAEAALKQAQVSGDLQAQMFDELKRRLDAMERRMDALQRGYDEIRKRL